MSFRNPLNEFRPIKELLMKFENDKTSRLTELQQKIDKFISEIEPNDELTMVIESAYNKLYQILKSNLSQKFDLVIYGSIQNGLFNNQTSDLDLSLVIA
jgi:phosphoenolpyruvate synthase/pyruvate phosphate dikinase